MAQHEHQTGSSVFVTANFTDPTNSDAPVNPSTVTLVITAPDSSETDVPAASITNTGVGAYEYILALPLEGTYRWKWTGSIGQKVVVIPGSCDSVERRA